MKLNIVTKARCTNCLCSVTTKLNILDRIEKFFGQDEFLKFCDVCKEDQLLIICK